MVYFLIQMHYFYMFLRYLNLFYIYLFYYKMDYNFTIQSPPSPQKKNKKGRSLKLNNRS